MSLKSIDNLPSQVKIWTKYLNCKLTIHQTIARIHFNKQYLQMKVIPKYASIKIKNTSKAAIKPSKKLKLF